MNTHVDKTHVNKSQLVSNGETQVIRDGQSTSHFSDNKPEAIAQRKLQEMANSSPEIVQRQKLQEIGNNSPQVSQLRALQEMANNSPQVKQMAQLQAMANNHSAQQHQPIQKKENNTGLPDNLKTGMENLSGMSLDDVKVHRNSDKPAQLQAHAYAQGTDIHLGPGQEKHLPHEAWHVVQQKQGRVKPTVQLKGKVYINDDPGLEKEADVMGVKALSTPAQLKQSAELIQFGGGLFDFFKSGDRAGLLEENPEREGRFKRIQELGRIAASLNETIANRRRDDVLKAAKEIAFTMGKATVFAGVDALAPGVGTAMGYAEAAASGVKGVYDASKTGGAADEAKGLIAETALTEGATHGIEAAAGGMHYAAAAAIASGKALYEGVKAVGQSDHNRKSEKLEAIAEFNKQIEGLNDDIIEQCEDLIQEYMDGSNSNGPNKDEMYRVGQINKAKGRLVETFKLMKKYYTENSEHAHLLEDEARSHD